MKYLDQSTGLSMLHKVTQEQAILLLELFHGDMVVVKRLCEMIDRGTDFFEVYLIASMSRTGVNE